MTIFRRYSTSRTQSIKQKFKPLLIYKQKARQTPIKKTKKSSITISTFIIWIIIAICITAFITVVLVDLRNQSIVNEYFQAQYTSTIGTEGDRIISLAVNESLKYDNETDQLNKIADLVLDNFTGIFFVETQKNLFQDCWHPFSYRHFSILCTGYGFDKNGKVRAENVPLANNATWIAYQKTGACGEVAALFAEIANRSNYSTRIVCGNGNYHSWDEVSNDGGKTWKYFDVTRYHDLRGNLDNTTNWFDYPRNYFKNNPGFSFSSICICGTDCNIPENNLSQNYIVTSNGS